jgi:hypothetical protein
VPSPRFDFPKADPATAGRPFLFARGEPAGRAAHDDRGMNVNLNYLLSVLCFILWIVALVDCIKSNNPNKVVWIIVIILVPFLGSILYFLIGKSKV